MDFLVLTKTGGVLGPFATILGYIINYIYKGLEIIGIPNVALSIIIFTLLVNLIMLPLTIKQQKSTKMMSVMNPEIQKVQAKYKGKKDEESMRLMQAETQAIYAKYGASPTGGCIYMVIQLPILFALYQVIYRIPAYITSVNDLYMQIAEPISKVAGSSDIMNTMIEVLKLRVRNFDPTSTASIVDFLSALKTVNWGIDGAAEGTLAAAFANSPDVMSAITEYAPQIFKVNSIFGVLNMSDLPTTNGWFPGILIPILAGLSQYISVKISMASNPQQNEGDNSQMANSMKSMNTIMPLFSVVMCFSFQVGIGIYWIINAVIRTIFMVIANKTIDKKGLDVVIAESREKAKKKAEKRGDKPSKLQQYASMSTKGYDQPVKKKKSISEVANMSTISEAEKAQMKKESAAADQKSEVKKADPVVTKTASEESKPAKKGLFGKKEEEPQNIAAIAHMLDRDR